MEKILNQKLRKTRSKKTYLSYTFIISIFIALGGISLVSALTIISDDSSIITIEGGKVCSENGNTWINTDTGVTIPTTGPFGDCYDDTLVKQTCCPIGQICNIITEKCELTEKNICDDLDETECGDYLQVVADKSMNDIKASDYCGNVVRSWEEPGPPPEDCVEVSVCSCVWDGVKCNAKEQLDEYCVNSGYTAGDTCTYTVQGTPIDKCNEDGFMYYQWQGVGNLPGCIENTGLRPVPCESSVRLGFFNWISFIAVIFILGIYYFVNVKRLE